MNDSVTIVVDWPDFSRDGLIPLSNLYFWGQRCRHKSFASGLLRDILATTGGLLMVKAQRYEFVELCSFGPSTQVEVKQRVSSVGKTSITLATEFFANGKQFAFGHVAIVSVKDGKVESIPPTYVEILSRDLRSDLHAHVLKDTAALLRKYGDCSVQALHEVLWRSSDEDSNSHVNQARYAQVFEDALQQIEDIPIRLQSLFTDYLKEARRGETCFVRIRRSSPTSASLQMYREDDVICNGFATWKIPQSL